MNIFKSLALLACLAAPLSAAPANAATVSFDITIDFLAPFPGTPGIDRTNQKLFEGDELSILLTIDDMDAGVGVPFIPVIPHRESEGTARERQVDAQISINGATAFAASAELTTRYWIDKTGSSPIYGVDTVVLVEGGPELDVQFVNFFTATKDAPFQRNLFSALEPLVDLDFPFLDLFYSGEGIGLEPGVCDFGSGDFCFGASTVTNNSVERANTVLSPVPVPPALGLLGLALAGLFGIRSRSA